MRKKKTPDDLKTNDGAALPEGQSAATAPDAATPDAAPDAPDAAHAETAALFPPEDAPAPDAANAGAETEETEESEPAAPEDEASEEGEADGENKERPLTPEELRAATEALLFAAIEPLKLETLAKALGKGVRRDAVEKAIKELNAFYAEHGRAFAIVEVSGKFALMSKAEFAPFIQRLYGNKPSKEEADRKLSPALLDTLSIIAYKQPVTRAEVENVRGVGCGQIIRQLMERGSVKPVGKKMDVIGYPTLYGTTEEFLREFGLGSLDELPMLAELRRLQIIDDPEKTSDATQTTETPKERTNPMFTEDQNEEEEGDRFGRPQDDDDDDEEENEEEDEDEEDEEYDDEDGDEDEEDDEDDEDEEEYEDDDEEDEDGDEEDEEYDEEDDDDEYDEDEDEDEEDDDGEYEDDDEEYEDDEDDEDGDDEEDDDEYDDEEDEDDEEDDADDE